VKRFTKTLLGVIAPVENGLPMWAPSQCKIMIFLFDLAPAQRYAPQNTKSVGLL
jgi:hypothetical protein